MQRHFVTSSTSSLCLHATHLHVSPSRLALSTLSTRHALSTRPSSRGSLTRVCTRSRNAKLDIFRGVISREKILNVHISAPPHLHFPFPHFPFILSHPVTVPNCPQLSTSVPYPVSHFRGLVHGALNSLYFYRQLTANYSPTLWISSRFPFGYESDKSTIQDLTGTGLTVTGPIGRNLELNSTSRIISTATYAKTFTFFIKAKRTNTGRHGRAFTSTSGNKLFGWWLGNRRPVWIEGNFYVVADNKQVDNNEVNTYMLVSNNDTKDFYEGKTKIINTTNGGDDWEGSVVIGRPTAHPNENTDFKIYEAIAFPTALTKTQMFEIHDKILT